jgi:hypothetical protein
MSSPSCPAGEDGLRAAYAPPHARAKLAEVALALAPIAARIDFAAGGAAAEAAPVEALRAVRGCPDMKSFQRGLDRGREARSLDCARLATGGQGHCHTLSCVVAAFLAPFQDALGVDVCYRGSDSFDGLDVCAPAPAPAPAGGGGAAGPAGPAGGIRRCPTRWSGTSGWR